MKILVLLLGAATATLSAQTVHMGPMTPPLDPVLAGDLDRWTDAELYAYENGLIEGVWAVAGAFFQKGNIQAAYSTLTILGAYWWQISKPAGMRGAMAFVRAMYSKAKDRLAKTPLYVLVLMEAGELERISR